MSSSFQQYKLQEIQEEDHEPIDSLKIPQKQQTLKNALQIQNQQEDNNKFNKQLTINVQHNQLRVQKTSGQIDISELTSPRNNQLTVKIRNFDSMGDPQISSRKLAGRQASVAQIRKVNNGSTNESAAKRSEGRNLSVFQALKIKGRVKRFSQYHKKEDFQQLKQKSPTPHQVQSNSSDQQQKSNTQSKYESVSSPKNSHKSFKAQSPRNRGNNLNLDQIHQDDLEYYDEEEEEEYEYEDYGSEESVQSALFDEEYLQDYY